eukprot:tig00020629_g12445.t1
MRTRGPPASSDPPAAAEAGGEVGWTPHESARAPTPTAERERAEAGGEGGKEEEEEKAGGPGPGEPGGAARKGHEKKKVEPRPTCDVDRVL